MKTSEVRVGQVLKPVVRDDDIPAFKALRFTVKRIEQTSNGPKIEGRWSCDSSDSRVISFGGVLSLDCLELVE